MASHLLTPGPLTAPRRNGKAEQRVSGVQRGKAHVSGNVLPKFGEESASYGSWEPPAYWPAINAHHGQQLADTGAHEKLIVIAERGLVESGVANW